MPTDDAVNVPLVRATHREVGWGPASIRRERMATPHVRLATESLQHKGKKVGNGHTYRLPSGLSAILSVSPSQGVARTCSQRPNPRRANQRTKVSSKEAPAIQVCNPSDTRTSAPGILSQPVTAGPVSSLAKRPTKSIVAPLRPVPR